MGAWCLRVKSMEFFRGLCISCFSECNYFFLKFWLIFKIFLNSSVGLFFYSFLFVYTIRPHPLTPCMSIYICLSVYLPVSFISLLHRVPIVSLFSSLHRLPLALLFPITLSRHSSTSSSFFSLCPSFFSSFYSRVPLRLCPLHSFQPHFVSVRLLTSVIC